MAQYVPLGTVDAPADWVIPGSLTITPVAVHATFDGSGAPGDYLPTLEIVSDSGHTVGRYVSQVTVPAGGSAEMSWAPFLRGAQTTLTAQLGIVRRFASQTIPSGIRTLIAWDGFETTDPSVFTTSPNGATGDTELTVLKPGLVIWQSAAYWDISPGAVVAGLQPRAAVIGGSFGFTQESSTAAWDGTVGALPQTDLAITTTAGISSDHLYIFNKDTVPRDVVQAWLFALWFPVPDPAIVTVY